MSKQQHKDSHLDDLHMALRSCNEIGSAKTLSAFLIDLAKLTQGRLPLHPQQLKDDRAYLRFLEGVILCTEQDYDEATLAKVAGQDPRFEYRHAYVDLISKVVEELLLEGKVNKL